MGKIKLVMCERCKVVQDFKDVCKCGSPKFVDLNMSKQSEFEEFIFNEVCRLSTQELSSHESPTVFEAGTLAAKATAAHILKVAEEWCVAPVYKNGRGKSGRDLDADALLDYLKQYINQEEEEEETEDLNKAFNEEYEAMKEKEGKWINMNQGGRRK